MLEKTKTFDFGYLKPSKQASNLQPSCTLTLPLDFSLQKPPKLRYSAHPSAAPCLLLYHVDSKTERAQIPHVLMKHAKYATRIEEEKWAVAKMMKPVNVSRKPSAMDGDRRGPWGRA